MKDFTVGAWRVQPDEGLLTQGAESTRLQPKVMQVLVELARRPGQLVTREELFATVWEGRVVTDETLTRCIKELRAAFDDSAGEPKVIETLHRRGYRLIAPVSHTEEGAAGTGETSWVRRVPWRRVLPFAAIAALLVIAILAWNVLRPGVPESGEPAQPTVAVLPFVNLSASAEQEFLADGVTETLTQVLARNPRLRVVARTSAFAFKNRSLDVREIGRQLGAGVLLEGSVQRSGDTLRVTVQLVSSETGAHLWSDAFDRPVDDLFAMQDEIAAEVAAALHVTLFDEMRPADYGAQNFDAYLAYVRGLQGMRARTIPSMAAAIEQYRMATELDPTFALAWVGLAEAILVNQWYADVPLAQALAEAEPAIGRALELEPGLGEAWSVVGLLEFKRAEYAKSEEALKRAIALSPNDARAWFQYGTLLNDTGRPAEALEMHTRSAELDPLAPVVLIAIGVALEKLGRFEEALEQYRKVIRVDASVPGAHDRLGYLLWTAFGQPDQALAEHREALRLDPGNTWTRALVADMALDLGDQAMAEAWVEAALHIGASKLYPNRSGLYLAAWRDDHPAERMALARRWLADSFTYLDVDTMLRFHRDAALELGQPQEALDLYRKHLPALFDPDTGITTALYGPAIDVASLLRGSGDEALADRLLAGAWEVVAKLPRGGCCGHGIADVEILALTGRPEEAMARLQEAYDDGFRSRWWWETWRNPNLAALEDRADYQRLLKRFHERAEGERALLPEQRLP